MTQTPASLVKSLGDLESLANVTGAAGTAVVDLEAAVMALPTLALTFVVFLLAGATLGRRSRWSEMLPFTRVLVGLLCPAVAAVIVWVLLAATALSHAPLAALALAAAGAAATSALGRRATARTSTRIAVVGSAYSADQLQRELVGSGVQRHELVGVVVAREPAGDMLPGGPVPVLGGLAELAGVLERHDVDILLIDGEASRIEVFDQLAETCLDLPVRVCELTQFYEDALGHVQVTEINSAWFRYIMHPRFRRPDTVSKRTLDLTVALLAGVVFLPVMGLCALLIKLQDGGPVMFRQRRIGSRGREFTMLKLRTMRTAPSTARWSSARDERVTRVGRFLRRTHIDEIPQLVNVLRGEMSVVGPRPEQPEFVERLEHALPHYSRRHMIKPGLTGWAQVRCGYAGSDAGSAWKLCHDLFYLKHQSLWLDLAILAETARTLVADRQFPAPVADGVPAFAAPPTGDAGALVLQPAPAN